MVVLAVIPAVALPGAPLFPHLNFVVVPRSPGPAGTPQNARRRREESAVIFSFIVAPASRRRF